MSDEINQIIEKIDKQLKPFQMASVNYVLDQLENKGRNKVLIADEVGLGKTIIAKGVIAKLTAKYQDRKSPFHVVYICSNQALAQQNIRKLNSFSRSINSVNRLVFLAYKPYEDENPFLKLSSLTPGTSFQLTQSVGYKDERAIIFCLLHSYKVFQTRESELRRLMKGNRVKQKNWDHAVNAHIKNRQHWFRQSVAGRLRARLRTIPFSKDRFPKSLQYLQHRVFDSFWVGLMALLKKLARNRNAVDPMGFSYEIIRALRQELTKVCVTYLDADLFILDEFQRFKSLIDGQDHSEAGEIAKAVLHNNEAKVLLLSATPFKPFTTQMEQLQGEDHHDEFRKIVEFLGGSGGKELWKQFRQDQKTFFTFLRHPKNALENLDAAINSKNKLEKSFKSFLSRNERMNVAKEYDNMVLRMEDDQITVIKDDIKNFITLDKLVNELYHINPDKIKRFGSTLEFSKSAPFPLSYLQGYKLRNLIEEHKKDSRIKFFFKTNEAWLPYGKIQKYKPIGFDKGEPTYPNGKLRILAKECFKHNAEFLLWVPPSKPLYQPFSVYKEAQGFSKILIFSGWVMVPRAISTLLSYEIERRTIGAENLEQLKETEPRTYFKDSGTRKPSPLLTYSISTNKHGKTTYKMSNFTLAYPSMELRQHSIYNAENFEFNLSFKELRGRQKKLISALFFKKEIQKKYARKEKIDPRWYWIATPLIDFLNPAYENFIDYLIHEEEIRGEKEKHLIYLKNLLTQIRNGDIILGQFPKNLFDILAETLLASPANASLFAFENNRIGVSEDYSLFKESFSIADAFMAHFNKPESICAIRMTSKGKAFWRKVLNYCAAGNIASMLNEYFYLLKECDGMNEISAVREMMRNVLLTRPSSINVDLQDGQGQPVSEKIRCHFAVSYGIQKMDTESGKNRLINVRTVFNSPFRPFVLTSTSIGQEGLDFHYYCRKIFHWNLPHNAIDLEQREGRINRYKGLVIRNKIANTTPNLKLKQSLKNGALWEILFNLAENRFSSEGYGIKPFWYIDEGETRIERFIPIHKFSKDKKKYEQLKKTLALYRLTFGQPRQEELVEALKEANLSTEQLNILRESLLINLSPLKHR